MIRGFVTFSALVGLFCVLTGCTLNFREATVTKETLKIETSPVPETYTPETSPSETQKIPETEETMPRETIFNLENTPSEEAQKWITLYEEKGNPTAILMNEAEISVFNEKTQNVCPTMYDMREIPQSILGSDVAKWISHGRTATEKTDHSGNAVSPELLDAIESNKNLSAIPPAVIPQTAIVTKRTNIRTVPTEERLYNKTDVDRYFDLLQEAELILGTPVLILHKSEDGEFCYIQSYYYRGWVKACDLALTDEENYREFLPETFAERVTVISHTLTLDDGTKLDMGAVFPYVSSDPETFTVELPRRDESGILYTENISIPKTDAYYGRLPYTMENFITQAFKFLGTDYSWGGYNEGVDCSGFVCAVFRSFGIYLPRNTGEQKEYGGTIHPLSGLEKTKINEILKKITYPTTIHRPGHVMLFLGIKDEKIYVIHAPTGGQKVSVMELWKTDNLISAVSME